MATDKDCLKIAEAFRQIQTAAMQINGVLGNRDDLNETVPISWPLNLSADEFAAACAEMVDHYEALAEKQT